MDRPSVLLTTSIDISNDDNTELCEKCNVESIPTCILFKKRSSLGVVSGNNISNYMCTGGDGSMSTAPINQRMINRV